MVGIITRVPRGFTTHGIYEGRDGKRCFAVVCDRMKMAKVRGLSSRRTWARIAVARIACLLRPQQKLAADNPKFPIEHDIDRLGVSDVLLLQNSCCERVLIIAVCDRHGFLHDDGTVVEFLIDKMHGATGNLDAVGESLLLGFEAGE